MAQNEQPQRQIEAQDLVSPLMTQITNLSMELAMSQAYVTKLERQLAALTPPMEGGTS